MNSIILTIFTVKVGLFGFTTTTKDYITLDNMDQCKNKLAIQYQNNKQLEIKKNETALKITDKANHTIKIYSCR